MAKIDFHGLRKELELYESYANQNTGKSFLCVGVCPPSGVGLLENF